MEVKARATRVKDKRPAPIQITAEQILREAREKQEPEIRPPKLKITDRQELDEYRFRKRKQFEDVIRRARWDIGMWVKYAHWEENQKDFPRARSVWERALLVEKTNPTLWMKYAEMEMRNKNVNHARNVWDKAVSVLPRVDQLWYKYVHMEEMLVNLGGARQIFERWMSWEPDHHGWAAYIRFELRYNEVDKARAVYERYVQCIPTVKAWVRYAKFEFKTGDFGRARKCYERAVIELGEDGQCEELFVAFADFEEQCKEYERARCIYKYALDNIPKARAEELYKKFFAFEKQHGNKEGVEDVIISKRRFEYEDEVKKNPLNYDCWFDYIRLETSMGGKERIRDVYSRAIANVPPAKEKCYWQRYIYFWINYALYEELDAEDTNQTRAVYRACLDILQHQKFTFAKIWLLAAKFEVRQKNLLGARKLLGEAIGKAPKDKIFNTYIEMEMQLGNIHRCRTLYEKYMLWNPANCYAWCKFAEFEQSLGETERSREIFELAISQPVLDMPELLWKAYIDFEINLGEIERTRHLYETLLDRTKHLKVWLSYAKFEARAAGVEEGSSAEELKSKTDSVVLRVCRARGVFQRAFEYFRSSATDQKEDRKLLLDEWQQMEQSFGEYGEVDLVQQQQPRTVKRRRAIAGEDGCGKEEFYDYIFPEETSAALSLRILENAYKWKKQKSEIEVEVEVSALSGNPISILS